ncbi:MAG: hypothetical protein E6Q97_20755 [Desulfurellales bacterium]|nr:MAG: hypothetical protein E6Q97_20755 [Desulfurellales bacterium]
METVTVCEVCGRELRSVDGNQFSGCVHHPADFPALLKSLPDSFVLIAATAECPKCKATMNFNHVATDEVCERSVHCASCDSCHRLLVGPVRPEEKNGSPSP